MTELQFYSSHDCQETPRVLDCLDFVEKSKITTFPCVILLRRNNWNDFSCFTNFNVFYLPKEKSFIELGYVCIMQAKAQNLTTTLPLEFKELPKKEFFSRGKLHFYNKLNEYAEVKNIILDALNDIHRFHYSQEEIRNIDPELIYPYTNSLFREDYYEIEVSSEYYKNSMEMLTKIISCLNSISELGPENQRIIRNLLFGSAVTTLESYLGDAFKYHILRDKRNYYSFLKKYKFSTEQKYSLNELGNYEEGIKEFLEGKVRENLNNIIFHKVDLVINLYKEILNIDLQTTLGNFKDAIQKRHDIFHRNGKNLAGEILNIEELDIRNLVSSIKRFVGETQKIILAQT